MFRFLKTSLLIVLLAILGITLGSSGTAVAKSKGSAKKPAVPSSAGPQKARVLRFGDLMIEGEGKSPQVYYLLNRKRIDLGHKPAEEDLLSPVKDSVRDKPF